MLANDDGDPSSSSASLSQGALCEWCLLFHLFQNAKESPKGGLLVGRLSHQIGHFQFAVKAARFFNNTICTKTKICYLSTSIFVSTSE